MKLPDTAKAALRAALDSFERHERGEARARLADVLDHDPTYATRVVASRVLVLLRDYSAGLDQLRLATSAHPRQDYALRMEYALTLRLRFYEEAHDTLQRLLARKPSDPKTREAAALFFQSMGEPRVALDHLERVIKHDPSAAHWHRVAAELAAQLGEASRAVSAAEAARASREGEWASVADALLEAGAFDALEAMLRSRPEPAALARRAELALFRNDLEEAVRLASSAAGESRATSVLVAAHVLRGELESAERLTSELPAPLRPADLVWRAELNGRRGDLEAATRALEEARNEVPDYLAAKLVWSLVSTAASGRQEETAALSFEGLLDGQIQATGVDVNERDGAVATDELRRAAEHALVRLGGNRTPHPSCVNADGLVPLRVPPSSRHRARRAQHQVLWRGMSNAIAAVDAVLDDVGEDPVAMCYRGELDLWRGDGQRALSMFERICEREPRTFWSWVGRGAAHLLLGEPTKTLAVLEEGKRRSGREGASLPVYQAEALWRTGEHERASKVIQRVTRTQPTRAAAWVLQALIADAANDDAIRDRTYERLLDRAPALMSDATAQLASPALAPDNFSHDVCHAALKLMVGNRSSSCPFYVASDGRARTVLMNRPVTSSAWERDEVKALGEVLRG